MGKEHVLDSTSFASLDNAGQEAVKALFQSYKDGFELSLDHKALFKKRQSLGVTLQNALHLLNTTNPASFKFLSPIQRDALREELHFSFYVFSAQYQLDESEHQRQGLPILSESIRKCAQYIDSLTDAGKPETVETPFEKVMNDSEKHLKYLGLTIVAPFVIDKIFEFTTGKFSPERWSGANKTGQLVDEMSSINGVRLYWVWGRAFLSSVLEMLPKDFYNKADTQKILAAPAPFTGYMSWILYYTRFGISLGLLLKHWIVGPWMSKKEQEIPAWDRLKTQWKERKFALLNDSIWATANLACFYWLIGEGSLGYMGNVATAALLLMDIGLTVWKLYEKSTEHNLVMLRYQQDLEALQKRLSTASGDEKDKLELQYKALLRVKTRCEFEWKYQLYGLINDLVYAMGLCISFVALCGMFFPPLSLATATFNLFSIIGATLCFTLTTAYSAANGGLGLAKSNQLAKMDHDEAKLLLEQFNQKETPDFVKKQLYLEIKEQLAQSTYQQALAKYQRMQMIRSLLADVLIPPLIFVSFMFLPFGIGLGILAVGFTINIISKLILQKFEPKAPELPDFDEVEFEKIAQLPSPTLDDFKKPLLGAKSQKSSASGKDKFFPTPTTLKQEEGDGDADSVSLEGGSPV